jgi:hypothetical protein
MIVAEVLDFAVDFANMEVAVEVVVQYIAAAEEVPAEIAAVVAEHIAVAEEVPVEVAAVVLERIAAGE